MPCWADVSSNAAVILLRPRRNLLLIVRPSCPPNACSLCHQLQWSFFAKTELDPLLFCLMFCCGPADSGAVMHSSAHSQFVLSFCRSSRQPLQNGFNMHSSVRSHGPVDAHSGRAAVHGALSDGPRPCRVRTHRRRRRGLRHQPHPSQHTNAGPSPICPCHTLLSQARRDVERGGTPSGRPGAIPGLLRPAAVGGVGGVGEREAAAPAGLFLFSFCGGLHSFESQCVSKVCCVNSFFLWSLPNE